MFLENLIGFLRITVEKPRNFGTFHVASLILMTVAIVLVVVFGKKISDKTLKIILISIWATLVLGEIYRQLDLGYKVDGGKWVYEYDWSQFPFQFCSSPLYVLPCVIFIKHGKTRQFFYDFLATFSLFAGLIVMFVPGNVFSESALINVQSMVHHGAMVVVAVLMYVTGKVKFSVFTVLRGAAVFGTLLVIALILNATIIQPKFNMFYINWRDTCRLPLLEDIQKLVPYPVFLMIYIVGFIICAAIMHVVAFGFDCLRKLTLKSRKEQMNE